MIERDCKFGLKEDREASVAENSLSLFKAWKDFPVVLPKLQEQEALQDDMPSEVTQMPYAAPTVSTALSIGILSFGRRVSNTLTLTPETLT